MFLMAGTAYSAAALAAGPGLGQSTDRQVEGGIGGTGIVGLLTEFGSILINGKRITTDHTTAFSDGFGPIRETSLRIGDSLTIEASGPDSALVARRVHITHPVVGAISAVSNTGRTIRINGVDIHVPTRLTRASVGERVAVSGLWRGNTVVASSLRAAHSTLDLVSGDVSRSRGAAYIGAVRVRGRGTAHARSGSFATAIGVYDPAQSTLTAQRLTVNRFTGAAGPLQQLSIEGYLEPIDQAPGFRVAGLGHSFERNLRLRDYADKRVLFSGPYTGKFAADRAILLPESTADRRRVLRQVLRRD